jgi:hypothetical protein
MNIEENFELDRNRKDTKVYPKKSPKIRREYPNIDIILMMVFYLVF